jgi:HPt (histidine-containing phosphotransfer) domain-containing protein
MQPPLEPAKPVPDATRKLLASLWERNLPVLQQRLDTLEHAVAAARLGTLTPALRAEAIDLAHKLSGSLGMFGYPEATTFARGLETHFEAAGEPDALKLAQDLAALRATLSL